MNAGDEEWISLVLVPAVVAVVVSFVLWTDWRKKPPIVSSNQALVNYIRSAPTVTK